MRLARARVRQDRFRWFESHDVIVVIMEAGPSAPRTLATYATQDPDEVIGGHVQPFLKLYPGGVDMLSCDEYYGWPWGEALWSAFHNDDLSHIGIERRTKLLLADWMSRPVPGWEPVDRGKSGLSIISHTIAPDGEDLIVAVEPDRIAIYAGDIFSAPTLTQKRLALAVPHYAPDTAVLSRYLPHRLLHEAKYIMRWYRKLIYDLVLAEAKTAMV
ncbi:hypothetical protein FY034_13165 [Trichlorobacter lovleyi]|nr:hypothetical protein FY034_13165 [Trichlorobacter lovleyi]